MKNQIKIGIIEGDIANQKYEAYIIPQYSDQCSERSVARAVSIGGARQGMEEYKKVFLKEEALPFGSLVYTHSFGGNSLHLLHVAILDCKRDKKFSTIQRAVYVALKTAEEKGIATITSPALGLEKADGITTAEAAMAIFSAVNVFPNKKGVIKEFNVILHNKPWSCLIFQRILTNELYRNAKSPTEPDFDLLEWARKNL